MASDGQDYPTDQAVQTPGYTIELRLKNQRVVIVGAGPVAMRKIPDLLLAGATICIIDPDPPPNRLQSPQITHIKRYYLSSDLRSARLVFAATNNAQVNAKVAEDAASLKILCCRVDCAETSDFISPARLLQPPLSFSVSTGGESPAMASVLRKLLDEKIPRSWQTATALAAAIRRKLLTEQLQIPYNQRVLLQLVEEGLLSYLEEADHAAIDQLLLKHFGADFSLENLHLFFT